MDEKLSLEKVVLRKEGNVIYVDLVLNSLVKAVEEWYEKHYQCDAWDLHKKANVMQIITRYEDERFRNHETLGKERDKYLEEVDLYIQSRRDE